MTETHLKLFEYYRPMLLKAGSFSASLEAVKIDKEVPPDLYEFFYTHYGHNGMLDPEEAFKQMYCDILKPYTLHLTLHKKAFAVMITGEKTEEFRNVTDFINFRLFDTLGNEKDIRLIKFVNGYSNDKPAFICEFKGFQCCYERYGYCMSKTYSNGLKVKRIDTSDMYVIDCGNILLTMNVNK